MIQLTMTGEYSIRAMLYLASKPAGAVVQIREIAEDWEIPEKFLRKIVLPLSRAGLLQSQRGMGGGIRLAKPADSITVLDVVEAAEGPFYLNKCLIAAGMCDRDSWCAAHPLWREAQEKMMEVLRSKTLAQAAEESMAQREAVLEERRRSA